MNKLLVTTGLNQTWGESQEIIFLGEWCLEYNKLEYLKKRKYQVQDYHWKKEDKFFKDHMYLKDLNEKVINSLSKQLNEIHNMDFSIREWRIIVGIFTATFIGVLWDRYESLKTVFDKYRLDTFTTNKKNLSYIPNDYDDFSKLNRTHLWNFILCNDIIDYLFKDHIKTFNYVSFENYKSKNIYNSKSNIKYQLSYIYDIFLKKIIKNYNVVFTESYLDFSSLFKISTKINQLPRFHYEFQKKIISNTNFKDRENLKLNIDSNNKFEDLIKNLFFKYLPKSYLESFSTILQYSIKNNIECKKIYTAVGHLHNDTFNIWSAYKVKNGTKLYVSQHGGSLRPKTTGDFDHQIKISDKFITWHKEYNNKHIRLTPNKLIRIKNNSYKYKRNKFLTIIGFEAFMYTHRAQSTLHGACMPIEFADCVEIYKKLKSSIKKNVQYRYADYSESEGWFNTKQRLKDKLGRDVICKSKSMLDSFKKSKMLICKYPQTTFAEAMISNIPTILVFNKKYWHFDSNFLKVIEELKNSKIIFEEIQNATDHINYYWENLDEWWLSKKTFKAREDFFDMCCKYSNNWLEDWKNFLIS